MYRELPSIKVWNAAFQRVCRLLCRMLYAYIRVDLIGARKGLAREKMKPAWCCRLG